MGGGRGVGGKGPCGVCEELSSLTCGGCGEMHYCGREHQRQDWAKHRAMCCPYKEVTHPKLGRYLVASRRLAAGQQVMEDAPLALGPMCVSKLVCLGCHNPVPDEIPRCPVCWWPLCSTNCASSTFHVKECPVLAKDIARVTPPKHHGETPRYDVIMVLRVLLLQSLNPKAWETVCSMEHHMEKRVQESKTEMEMNMHVLRDTLGLDYTEEEVAHVRGVIATNAMQIQSPGNVYLRALHPKVRLFNHSCIPNLQLSYTDEGIMLVRTAVSLEAGDPMYVTYTGTTMPLWERHSCLKENYYFACECSRCSDPTEMDTNFSNPRCPECYSILMKPQSWLDTTIWVCPSCKMEKTEERVKEEALASISCLDMVDVMDASSYKRLQYTLEQVEHDYHAEHYVWMKVAQHMLCKLHKDETDRGLKLRVAIWQRLMRLYSKLEPGLTRRRGMAVLELGLSMMREVRVEYETSNLYLTSLIEQLKEAIRCFQEAEDVMSLEPKRAKMHVIVERARLRKDEAKLLLKTLESENNLTK